MPPRVDPSSYGGSDEEVDNLAPGAGRGRGALGSSPSTEGAAHRVGQLIAPNPQKRAELLASRAASERAAAQRNSGGIVGGSGVVGGAAAADVNLARQQRDKKEKREKEARRNAAEQERKRQEQQKIDDHRAAQRLKAIRLQQHEGAASAAVRDELRAHWAGEGRGAGRAAQGNREAAREGPGAAAATLQKQDSMDEVEDQIVRQVEEQSRREQEELDRAIARSLADTGPGAVGEKRPSAAAAAVGATSSKDQGARGGCGSSERGAMRDGGAMRGRGHAGVTGARAAASPNHHGEEPVAAPASGDSMQPQAARLQALLLAKRELDNALDAIEQCEAAGALTSAEASAQRAEANAAFERAKAEAAPRSMSPASSLPEEAGNMQVVARGRQVGAKNTADTRVDAVNGAVRGGACSRQCPCLKNEEQGACTSASPCLRVPPLLSARPMQDSPYTDPYRALQDEEYAEALAQDRLKDLAQSQVVVAGEQQAEDVVFAGEQLRAPEESHAAAQAQQKKEEASAGALALMRRLLPSEPPAVVVRMPDGSRLPSRRFKESDTVAHVYAYVRISMRERGNTEAFELISNMPALTLKEDDTSLADAQVQGQVLLICQPTA